MDHVELNLNLIQKPGLETKSQLSASLCVNKNQKGDYMQTWSFQSQTRVPQLQKIFF